MTTLEEKRKELEKRDEVRVRALHRRGFDLSARGKYCPTTGKRIRLGSEERKKVVEIKQPKPKWGKCLRCDRKIKITPEKRLCCDCNLTNTYIADLLDKYKYLSKGK